MFGKAYKQLKNRVERLEQKADCAAGYHVWRLGYRIPNWGVTPTPNGQKLTIYCEHCYAKPRPDQLDEACFDTAHKDVKIHKVHVVPDAGKLVVRNRPKRKTKK
jgi:hypothetical protein